MYVFSRVSVCVQFGSSGQGWIWPLKKVCSPSLFSSRYNMASLFAFLESLSLSLNPFTSRPLILSPHRRERKRERERARAEDQETGAERERERQLINILGRGERKKQEKKYTATSCFDFPISVSLSLAAAAAERGRCQYQVAMHRPVRPNFFSSPRLGLLASSSSPLPSFLAWRRGVNRGWKEMREEGSGEREESFVQDKCFAN